MESERCTDCKHAAHEPGQCPNDNCGDSELIRAADGYSAQDMEWGYGRYVASSLYDRKSQPREVFKLR